MSDQIQITIHIPSHAQSHGHRPYLEHTEFIRFCKANNVDIDEGELEKYEKNKLLYPCCRILYPRELLRRDFHARYTTHSQSYKIRDEWEPLITLEDLILKSRHWIYKEFEEAIEYGHPLERSIGSNNPYVVMPQGQKFKRWDRYKVIVDKCNSKGIKESRAKHYYAPWKLFYVYDLNKLNTDENNRATGSRRGWGIFSSKPKNSPLSEFIPFFQIVSSFTYRRSLLTTFYFEKTAQKQQDWDRVIKKKKQLAQKLFSGSTYTEWIRFLRKLIEIHENYRGSEKILLSLEAKSAVAKAAIFLRYANHRKFEEICDDVSGKFKNSRSIGMENGVLIYPCKLEELFPDERWDLEKNVSWRLEHGLKDFCASLSNNEKIPESLATDLFDDLSKEPSGSALAAISKINKSYFNQEIWRETDVWSGIRDLAVSLEVHGKHWLGGNKLNDVLTSLYPSTYNALKNNTGVHKPTDASNTSEFLSKLKAIQSSTIPANERCGRHLVIAHLTRNFSNHQKGLTGTNLQKSLPIIYSSLIGTLFVFYAKYKSV